MGVESVVCEIIHEALRHEDSVMIVSVMYEISGVLTTLKNRQLTTLKNRLPVYSREEL